MSAHRDWLIEARQRVARELRLIDEALATIGGPSTLPQRTPDACVEILRTKGAPMTPTEVHEILSADREVTTMAVFTALHRLAKKGALTKPRHGTYALPEAA